MHTKFWLALPALGLLAACSPQAEMTVRLSDILETAQSQAPVVVPAFVRIPEGDDSRCRKELPQLVKGLADLLPIDGDGRCMLVGNDSYAELKTMLTLVPAETDRGETSVLVMEVAGTDSIDPEPFTLTFLMTHSLAEMAEIEAKANGFENGAAFDGPPLYVIHIENDLQDIAAVQFDQVFVDGEARLPDAGSMTLAPGQSIEVKFSDVASTVLAMGNGYEFATIYPNLD